MTNNNPNQKSTNPLPPQLQLWEGSSAYVEQGRHWSSALIWLCSLLFGGTLIWAFTAKIDQTVTVRGRLEPSGSVREVDSPSGGVVRKVFVKDGDVVKLGQSLFDVEAKGLASRRQAVEATLRLYELQSRALKSILSSDGDPSRFEPLPAVPIVDDPILYAQLITARQQSQQFRSQLEQLSYRLASRKETLRLKQRIAADYKPLFEGGGMSRTQYLGQLNQVQEIRAEVATLREESSRLIGAVAAQLNQIDRQSIQLRAELVGLKEAISYRTVRAPVAGKVFDVKVSPQTVVNGDQTVLKLVPANRLQAKVEISDSDIGFVKVGLPVNVSVDSFPSGEFGYIKGTLFKLGSDALPPDSRSSQYRFPATVSLVQQSVESGNQKLNLQSGMGVSANIKLRSRPVISIVSDLFTKQMDGVKRFR
ncbi:HlyD family secretion protein [Synechococcus sp. HIMB2401]|uniref:HlyD family secretion protein n=1 Tax=Synechococcus sp. HIMB2401 TaxID=3144208 RepID=UPI0036F1C935